MQILYGVRSTGKQIVGWPALLSHAEGTAPQSTAARQEEVRRANMSRTNPTYMGGQTDS